jgi:hypothetical protein
MWFRNRTMRDGSNLEFSLSNEVAYCGMILLSWILLGGSTQIETCIPTIRVSIDRRWTTIMWCLSKPHKRESSYSEGWNSCSAIYDRPEYYLSVAILQPIVTSVRSVLWESYKFSGNNKVCQVECNNSHKAKFPAIAAQSRRARSKNSPHVTGSSSLPGISVPVQFPIVFVYQSCAYVHHVQGTESGSKRNRARYGAKTLCENGYPMALRAVRRLGSHLCWDV